MVYPCHCRGGSDRCVGCDEVTVPESQRRETRRISGGEEGIARKEINDCRAHGCQFLKAAITPTHRVAAPRVRLFSTSFEVHCPRTILHSSAPAACVFNPLPKDLRFQKLAGSEPPKAADK